ncbi:hypothetical protein GGX14DRAFT_407026 [Mycena pura]|uniref:Uncharacterized protein n=1 Tax=Mycena pura TaxID=153505 RepID=A0AAD6USY4_9AGAR|nr:hypothetical protein GGX14DRAFT_407026 [Mycena pura]
MAATDLARRQLNANDYADAIACLDDITTIYTDPNLTRIRSKLMRDDDSGGAFSDDIIRALEVRGIADAVAKRFRSTPHHSHATNETLETCCSVAQHQSNQSNTEFNTNDVPLAQVRGIQPKYMTVAIQTVLSNRTGSEILKCLVIQPK